MDVGLQYRLRPVHTGARYAGDFTIFLQGSGTAPESEIHQSGQRLLHPHCPIRMQPLKELLPGAWLLKLPRIEDARGDFTKLANLKSLSALGLSFDMQEQFVTRSRRNVIRGLHFQLPPHQHVKLVTCLSGRVEDVMVDLRRGQGYGRVACIDLHDDEPSMLYLPPGIAHGFRSRSDASTMLYLTSSAHAPSHDAGILWSSIDHNWDCCDPVLSVRDQTHPPLIAFESPF